VIVQIVPPIHAFSPQTMFIVMNVPPLENEDDYTIMGTIARLCMNKMLVNLTHMSSEMIMAYTKMIMFCSPSLAR